MRQALQLALLSLLVLAGCSVIPTAPPTYLPDQAQSFAAQVDGISENLLVAMGAGDEAGFLRDMEPKMREASSGDSFTELQQNIVAKIGTYVAGSKQMVKVDTVEGFTRVWYGATFAQEEHVQAIIVYDTSTGTPRVTGLWFDSPKLRK
jgi:hypothetical protein